MNKFIVLSLVSLFCFGCVTAEDAINATNPAEAQSESWKTFQMKEPSETAATTAAMVLFFDMPSSAIPVIIPQGREVFGFHTGGNPSYLLMMSEHIDAEKNETFATQVTDFIDDIKILDQDVEVISSVDAVTSQGYAAHDVTFLLPKATSPYRKIRLIELPSNNMYILCTFSNDGQDQHERFIDSFRAEAITE